MLTMLLLLTLSASPAQSYPCESPSVERPALALDAPEWAFVPVRPETACDITEHAEVTMAAMGFDDPFADYQHEPGINLEDEK